MYNRLSVIGRFSNSNAFPVSSNDKIDLLMLPIRKDIEDTVPRYQLALM